MIELTCKQCGIKFYRYPSDLKYKSGGTYCSNKCACKARKPSKLIGRCFDKLLVIKQTGAFNFLCKCVDCGELVKSCRRRLIKDKKFTYKCLCIKEKDITGRKFGRWTVIKPQKKGNVSFWECKCECGNTAVVRRDFLINGYSLSCGCLRKEVAREQGNKKVIDLVGKHFGRWKVIKRANKEGVYWICKCECGNYKDVAAYSLVSGDTNSCGCLHSELAHQRRYDPTITKEERERKRTLNIDELNKWRNDVFKRDSWKCIICGSKKHLNAHHKNGWNKYKNQRYVVENGETSCGRCHNYFHKLYGKGNNTEKQWLDFKNNIKNVNIVLPESYEKVKYAVTIGEKYNRLTILEKLENKRAKSFWRCKCDCGKETNVIGTYIKNGIVKSCGCLKQEMSRDAIKRRIKYVY